MNSITLKTDSRTVEIPVDISGVSREYDATQERLVDVCLHGQVMTGFPVGVTILLRSDGTWTHWGTDFKSYGNSYLHFSCLSGPESSITEAQRATLARWYLGTDRPFGMTIGGPVFRWAFAGLSPQEISDRYGDGRRVYANA